MKVNSPITKDVGVAAAPLRRRGERRIGGGALIMAVVVAACIMLGWHGWQRNIESQQQENRLVQTSSQGAAHEIKLALRELRRAMRLLVISEQARINALARDPDDLETYEALSASVHKHFPDAFAVTLADADGQELVYNFDGEILDICRSDISTFAKSGKPNGALIHPNPLGYHFDVTVAADLNGRPGVFFVSFYPERIVELLRTNVLDGYSTYLLKSGDDRGLIEVSGDGSRNQLEREFFLSAKERRRIAARVPVEGTQWDLVLLRSPDNAPGMFSKPIKDAAVGISLLLLIGMITAWWVRNTQLQVITRDRKLQNQAQELEHSEHRLQLLHRTTSAPNMGLGAKIDALLVMGLQDFGLDVGIVSRVQGEHYEVLYAISNGLDIQPGTVFDLGDTYCRHMLASGDAVGIADVGKSDWCEHPCYAKYGLESYIGAPIYINQEIVGTLNFSSAMPRSKPFTDRDLDLLRIMARWVGMELERDQAEQRLRRSEGYLQSILDTVGDGIVTVEQNGRISTFNRAAQMLFDYQGDQILDRDASVLIPNFIMPAGPHGDYPANPQAQSQERWARRRDGSLFPVEISISPMRGSDALRYCLMIRDISERRAADEKLKLNHRLLESISAAQSRFIAEEDDTRVFDSILQDLLTLTESEQGFIAAVSSRDDNALRMEPCAGIGVRWQRSSAPPGGHYLGFDRLCEQILENQDGGMALYEPPGLGNSRPARLVASIFHGSQLVGIAGIGGRAAGYSDELTSLIEPLLASCGNIIQAYRSDQQLRESTQMQAAILRNTRYMIIATDPRGTIVTFNQAAEQALGYCAEELIGKYTPGVFHDPNEVHERARSLSEEMGYAIEPGFEVFVHKSRSGDAEERVWTYIRKDGSRLSVLLSVSALTDHAGHITGFLGVAKDITEQLAAEESVRRSQLQLAEAEERSRLLLENAGDGIYGVDANGRAIFVNPAAARMLGYEIEELVGKPIHDLIRKPVNDAETAPQVYEGADPEATEEVLWRKDGSWFPVEFTSTPIRKEDQQMGEVVVFKDVTTARVADRALRLSEARLAEAQRIAHLGSWEWNILTDETYWSDETYRIFGYEPRAFEPNFSRAASHIHSDDRQRVMDAISLALANDQTYECSYRIITATGLERDVNDRGHLSLDEHGKPTRMIGILQDVTQQRKVDRMKNEFVSTVSHELRTPLTSIRGSLGLLSGKMGEGLGPHGQELIAIAQRNAERLLLLINDILDLSKIESGRLNFELRDLELLPFLEQTLHVNQGYLDQHEVSAVLCAEPQDWHVRADPDRLMQVMNNLLSNAAKFSPAGARIEVTAKRQDDRVRIAVRDFGCGIPEEFRAHVFDQFSQADSSDARQVGGTGLGLSISKAIIERHGGTIGFESETGQGTTFYFDLAVAEPIRTQDPEPETQPAERRVLVWESDPEIARGIGSVLNQHGYEADLASTAEDTRRLLEQQRYCALTLDLARPEGDEIDLLQELRADRRTETLPVVAIATTAQEYPARINGAVLDVRDWLEKPLDGERLIAALDKIEHNLDGAKPRVLHVEDDQDVFQVVRLLLKGHADVEQANSVAGAKKALRAGHFDLILLDLELPDGSGWTLIEEISGGATKAPAVVFSASELSAEHRQRVHHAFVKARTTDQELRESLLSALRRCRPEQRAVDA